MIVELLRIKKDIADAEASLSKLEQQEKKYSAQLEAALNEYTNLKVRGADFDAAELYTQRMILRADIMAAAVDMSKPLMVKNMIL